jgi:hypothetical protein
MVLWFSGEIKDVLRLVRAKHRSRYVFRSQNKAHINFGHDVKDVQFDDSIG